MPISVNLKSIIFISSGYYAVAEDVLHPQDNKFFKSKNFIYFEYLQLLNTWHILNLVLAKLPVVYL